jgi:DNA-binding MarR family transcriptional regulator
LNYSALFRVSPFQALRAPGLHRDKMSKTVSRTAPRDRLLVALEEAIRKVSAQAVLMSDLVATRVGINSTDLECLDLLQLDGPTTAGGMAERSGLTTGATTAMIDRLERAGYVRRRRDPDDRRVVVVEVVEQCVPHIAAMYDRIQKEFEDVHARYSNRELATVLRYLTDAFEAGARHVTWLQTRPAQSKHPARVHHVARGSFGNPPVRQGQEQSRRPARRKKRSLHDSR